MFSRAVWREGHCRQMSLACVRSTRSVPASLGLPLLSACVLSPSTLLRLQAALQGAGPALRGLPRPKPLSFRFSGTPQKHRLGWACVLCRPRPSSSGLQQPDGRTLPGCGAPPPLRSPSLVGVPSLGPSLPLSPPPASCLQREMGRSATGQLFSGIAQSFLCS